MDEILHKLRNKQQIIIMINVKNKINKSVSLIYDLLL